MTTFVVSSYVRSIAPLHLAGQEAYPKKNAGRSIWMVKINGSSYFGTRLHCEHGMFPSMNQMLETL